MKTGAELITEERQRQISNHGWSPLHDDRHDSAELAVAANQYVTYAAVQVRGGIPPACFVPKNWPWDALSWKPGRPLHNLVKAGALIAAEIDRLQRADLRAGVVSAVRDSDGWVLFDAAGDVIKEWPAQWPAFITRAWLEELGIEVAV